MKAASAVLATVLFVTPVFAQVSQPEIGNTGETPTIHAESGLVLVDVVATDQHGDPIPGLKAQDFTLLEDGKPRAIEYFESHLKGEAKSTETPPPLLTPKLPPNTFTNSVTIPRLSGLYVILVDLVNSDLPDQQFARQQLMNVVEQIPDGTPTTVFVLARGLLMTVPPTTDKHLLTEAARRLHGFKRPLSTTEAELQQLEGSWKYLKLQGGAVGGAPSALPRAVQEEVLFDRQTRQRATFGALRRVADSISAFPGRKSVIWLTGSIPVDFGIPLEPNKPNSELNHSHWAELSRMLAAARIAVYPIDTRGLRSRGVDISLSTSESTGLLSGDPGGGSLLRQQADQSMSERNAMKRLAQETGGRAFLTNDIAGAIVDCMNDGSYYTLAIKPASDDNYHKIEVRLARANARLRYRQGYFRSLRDSIAGNASSRESSAGKLLRVIDPDLQDETSLKIAATLQYPDEDHKELRLNYSIDPAGVQFRDGIDGKAAELKVLAAAYDQFGTLVKTASDTLQATIPLQPLDPVMKTGLPANQRLLLRPGVYTLRVGVLDQVSGNVGTITIPNVTIK